MTLFQPVQKTYWYGDITHPQDGRWGHFQAHIEAGNKLGWRLASSSSPSHQRFNNSSKYYSDGTMIIIIIIGEWCVVGLWLASSLIRSATG